MGQGNWETVRKVYWGTVMGEGRGQQQAEERLLHTVEWYWDVQSCSGPQHSSHQHWVGHDHWESVRRGAVVGEGRGQQQAMVQ